MEKFATNLSETQPAFWGGLYTEVIKFQNDMVARCFTLYTAVRIKLFSLVRQFADDLKNIDETSRPVLSGAIAEALKWSRIACQCIEYIFASNKMAAGRLSCLLAFDCAWSTFVILKEKYQMDMKRELLWCKSTADRITATGLPVFRLHEATTRSRYRYIELDSCR
jgi:Lon protease-like protein